MSGPAIVLIGFMGAGKSTAVRALKRAGLGPAEDVDAVIEAREGRRVLDLFHEDEEAFRAMERDVALELLAREEGGVIAFGGGTAMQPDVQAVLPDHTVVLMEVNAGDAWERVSASDRPLVRKGRDHFERLLEKRLPTYESLAQVVIQATEPDAIVAALPWIKALEKLPGPARMIWASSESGSYPIVIGHGILESDWWPLQGRRFCVCDPNTRELWTDPLSPAAEPIVIEEAGETAKTMATATWILEQLAEREMTREDYVIALGGGVVGDIGGLCAHLYQRGVRVVQVPTTLVAQVDSAYGGKTGVDLPQGKNYAGAFHQPAAVIVDVDALRTLPPDELAAGYVEVLKTGLLAGGRLWDRARELDELVPAKLGEIVFECAQFKCEVVADDERDSGRRHILNLGHTVGHAIEAATRYQRYRHGEAIGLGLLAALRLSEQVAESAAAARELREEVEAILGRHGLPVRLDADADVEAILDALGRDKKRTAAGVGFVLLAEPGEPRIDQLLEPDSVRDAVQELLP